MFNFVTRVCFLGDCLVLSVFWSWRLCVITRSAAHLRNHGSAKRRGHQDGIQHAGPLRRRIHAPHLHPRHPTKTGRSSGHDGCLHGADVVKTKIRKSRPGGTILLPGTLVSIVSFRQVGHGVGQTVDPHFDPHEKVQIRNKKHPKSDDFRCFLELLGGFEPPTSSLPMLKGTKNPCTFQLKCTGISLFFPWDGFSRPGKFSAVLAD